MRAGWPDRVTLPIRRRVPLVLTSASAERCLLSGLPMSLSKSVRARDAEEEGDVQYAWHSRGLTVLILTARAVPVA